VKLILYFCLSEDLILFLELLIFTGIRFSLSACIHGMFLNTYWMPARSGEIQITEKVKS